MFRAMRSRSKRPSRPRPYWMLYVTSFIGKVRIRAGERPSIISQQRSYRFGEAVVVVRPGPRSISRASDGGAFETTHAQAAHSSMSRSL